MKKQLLFMLTAMLLSPLVTWADDLNEDDTFTVDGITYTVTSTSPYKVAIGTTEYGTPAIDKNTTGELDLPSSVTGTDGNNYSVTSIGLHAFSGCSGLTSITIPNSVTSIGGGAFHGCSGLTSITIPNSVTFISLQAFSDCSGLTSITIPNSVKAIGEGAFLRCIGLTSITLPNSITQIFGQTFACCISLTSVTIPNSVKSIEYDAFSGCTDLTSVTIPNSVTSIGGGAFHDCSSLTSITIPDGVTSIGNGAFSVCSSLTSIAVDNGNTVYDSRDNCNAIIETASNELIAGCNNTVIPSSVTSIGYGAFSGCISLTSITIPSSVTSIGNSAFSGCSGLTSITIPNSVTNIGMYAFSGCTDLTSVTIPNSVTIIDSFAFFDCGGVKEVYSEIEEPFAISDNVFMCYDNGGYMPKFTSARLYVPAGTKDLYEVTDGWKNFSPNIIEMGAGEEETVPVGSAFVAGYSSDKALDFTGSDVTAWIATGFREGKIMLSKVDVVPANTGIYVKSTKVGDFDVPVTTEKAYYVNMFQPVVTAKTVQPTETVDGVTYQTLSFALSQTTGQPAFFPNTAEKTYGDNKMYLRLPEWVVNGATGAADSGTEPVTIGTLGVAGFSSNRNLDFTDSDVEAWIATGFKGGNVMLSRVYAVPAGTGVYVKSKKTLTQQTTFQIPVTTELPYYVNAFVGLPDGGTVHPTETVGGVTMQTLSFAKSQSTGKPAFFPNTADKTYGAGKMYLRLPADLVNSSARGIGFVFEGDEVPIMGETTGISEASPLNDKGQMINDKCSEVYNLNGQRLVTPRKGLNIIGGKKVVIK